ncbi:MAG: fumarate hydratase [Clostridia bacterium]|nr:fumarate hydratase [Clostridia bacterium]
MREILSEKITSTVKELFISANYRLGETEHSLINEALKNEISDTGKAVMQTIKDNLSAAEEICVPICQDTGMAILFAEIGQDVHITGENFVDAVNKGVSEAYTEGRMRASVVHDPLFDRVNTKDNTPAIIHTSIVPGDKITLTALPKGFGSENMGTLKMMVPTSSKEDIINFVVESVKKAGSNPCPPIMVGVGIGGSFDYAPFLAKKALARNGKTQNSNPAYAELEKELLEKINELGIGPQGFGGKTTALAVNVEYYPTHIAGLPVAVNINCHVMRHATAII